MLAIHPTFPCPRAFANPEPDVITRASTDRGDVFTVRNGDVTQSAFLVRLSDDAIEPLRHAMTALGGSMNTLAERANNARSEVHPARFPDVMRQLIGKYLSPAFQAATKAGVNEKRDADAAWKRVTAIEPAVGTVRQEYRQLWQSLSLADRAARVANADIDELAAIREGLGFFPDMKDTPIVDEIDRRYALLSTAKLYSLNGAFDRKPSAAKPLAAGPDNAQVEAEAQRLADTRKRRINDIEAVESSLCSVITAIAAATELNVEEAHKLLMARE
jgi:hypothetical protein